jgi:Spy/CpxP family protein refolding chaperone
MKSIRFRLLIAAMAILLGTVAAQSQTADAASAAPPPPMHGRGQWGMDGHMMGFFADYLNLSDAQQTQMKTAMQKERPTMKPLFQQSRQIDQQLRQYVEGTYDEAKVQALATQKAQIEAQLTVAQARLHNELFQLLTPDQQSKMKDMEARHQARMAKHMQQAPPASTDQQ